MELLASAIYIFNDFPCKCMGGGVCVCVCSEGVSDHGSAEKNAAQLELIQHTGHMDQTHTLMSRDMELIHSKQNNRG